ncbi:MAG TPA: PAS domain S-box protein [Rudaea sp.]|jgi:PAS domain S-box-containing protein|uniref:PAS domain S-box protein n=1 Tax=Rudaea sp. TaxID=2136325 RepID=UPI002F926675
MADFPALKTATFKALFETAPDAMVVIDASGCIILSNPQAERLFGYPPAGLTRLSVDALVPERVRQAHLAHRADYIRQPRVRPMGKGQELSGVRLDGSEFPAEIGLSPIESEDGRFYVASIRDISETQRARQAIIRARYDKTVAHLSRLALESQGAHALLDTAPGLIARELDVDAIAVALIQTQGRPLQLRASVGMVPAFQKIVAFLLSPECFSAVPRSEEAFIASIDELPEGKSADLKRMLAEGAYDNLVAVPLFDREGPMGALIAAARKRNAFDRDEVHFLRSVAHLFAAVAQRTRTEEQLAHAQRLEAVGQLTGGIAHDFNNLLTVISGNLQLLEDELADRPEVQDILAAALRATGRGAELTRKLLVFARRQRLNPLAIDMRTLLDELGPMLVRSLGEAVKVEIQCAPGMANVFVDPGELDAAILNLAINARDAMPRGGVLYIVARERHVDSAEASPELPAGTYVAIEVRDTGLGMTPDVLARAFEPFFTTKETGRGSGLGLSMVYGFVKQSGGHIVAESRLGYGTRIDLYLPAAASAPPPRAQLPPKPPPAGKEIVLVVEDEEDVRRIAVAFLTSAGYTTCEAANGEQALQILQSRRDVALLFSDVVLGSGMSGGELANAAQSLWPNLRVLLTSGYEHPTSQPDTTTPPSLPLLRKPYRREDLLASIRQSLTPIVAL